jgi:hypothetical protein
VTDFVRLRWRSSSDTTLVEIVRSAGPRASSVTLYRGAGDAYTDKRFRNGVRYRYTITGYDDARNAVARSMVAIPKAPLFSPPAGAKVVSPPLLAWVRVAHATYFNVQIWRKRQIFSAWAVRYVAPSEAKLDLPRPQVHLESRPVSVVRVAGLRHARCEALRAPAGSELVRHRSNGKSRIARAGGIPS